MAENETVDAIAIFRPKNKAMILPFLDLDDGSNEDGIYADELADGSFLVHTFQPFEVFDENPDEARAWLAQFGIALPEVHDDPRGFLFFPDDAEPEDAQSYEDVVKAIGEEGVWIAMTEDEDDEDLAPGDQAALDLQGLLGSMMGGGEGIDMGMLQKLAGQLMAGPPGADPNAAASSFEIGQMFEQMQRGLMETMAQQEKGAVVDDEFEADEPEPPAPPKK